MLNLVAFEKLECAFDDPGIAALAVDFQDGDFEIGVGEDVVEAADVDGDGVLSALVGDATPTGLVRGAEVEGEGG